jgi:DNA invertase Pin-like site-specific DNA recombinase
MPTAGIYCRLSRHRSTEQSASTQRQERACRQLCEDRGWTVALVEVDDDRSAYSGKPRPGYLRLLDAAAAGEIDALVAWHPDRLHRSPVELEHFIDVVEAADIDVATVQSGRIDLSTPAGRLQARLLGSIARYESEHRSERTRAAHEAIAAQGRWSGGKRVYGYRTDPDSPGGLTVVPAEADQVRDWVTSILHGVPLGQLVDEANTSSVPTVQGGPWTVPTLRGIVTSDRIAGRRRYRPTNTITTAQWEPIITPDELDAVRRTLALRGGSRTPATWRRYLLTGGLARCGICGAALAAQRSSTGAARYVCPTKRNGGCGGVSAVADRLEDTVALMACVAVAELEPTNPPNSSPPADTAGLEDRLTDLATRYAAGDITRTEWEAARGVIAAKLDAANRADRTDPLAPWRNPGALTEAWPDLAYASRRLVLDALMESVEVKPATRRGRVWDPDRVQVTWRA